MSTSLPRVKMKLAVHCAPAVYIITPGWMVAVAAGAHPPAGGAACADGVGMTAATSEPVMRAATAPSRRTRDVRTEVLLRLGSARQWGSSSRSGGSPAGDVRLLSGDGREHVGS